MDTIINMRGIIKRFYIGQPNELEILHGIDLDLSLIHISEPTRH